MEVYLHPPRPVGRYRLRYPPSERRGELPSTPLRCLGFYAPEDNPNQEPACSSLIGAADGDYLQAKTNAPP